MITTLRPFPAAVATAVARAVAGALALASLAVGARSADAQAFDRTRPPALGAAAPLVVPTVHAARLPNGPALQVVEHRELPLVQVTLTIAGGGRLDNDRPGLASFTANLLDEGAGRRDANALQAELAYLGASLSTGASWDAITVSLKVARRNLEPALDLMADVVLRPTFDATEVRRQRDLRAAGILQQRDQPASLGGLALAQAIFPKGHPYRQSLGGDSASTAPLDSAMVRDFYAGAFRPGRATFYVVGDLATAEAQQLLARRFGGWRATGPERRPAPVLTAAARPQGLQVILVDKPGAAQSIVTVGTTGVERTSADLAAIDVMNTILGGSFSSRLNTNLRETKGYTYGASSGFAYRPLPGPFTASAAVRTDVTDSSLVELFKELRAIRDGPVSDDELARAKAYITLGLPGDFESTSQVAGQMASLANWNLPLTWLQEYVQRIEKVTAADVQRVARQYVPAENGYVIVVGDLARIRAGIEALRLGPVTVRTVAELVQP
ncbi:MAG: insulinase family protein [Gemmatimonadaceae bacterium]|nr:insulinase family protein [Gemmatimonadaceae bacterium]